MIVKEHYDVIVVGADLAPLLCAALLCKRGFRVLVVGEGRVFDRPVPAITGQLGSPLASRILDELAIAQIVRRKEGQVDPLFQMVTPRCRISFYADQERLLEEYTRELPAEREAARLFYSRLAAVMPVIDSVLGSGLSIPPRGFIEKQRLGHLLGTTEFGQDGLCGTLLSPLGGAPGVRACVFSHVAALSRLDPRQIAPVHAALMHGRATRHQVAIEGGIAGLRELLLERISSSRGEVRLADRLEYVEVQRGRIPYVKLTRGESATGCDIVVCGIPLASLGALLCTEGRRLGQEPLLDPDLDVVSRMATMRLDLRKEVFPLPMARLVYVLFDQSAPPSGTNLAVLERGKSLHEGGEALWVSFLVDASRSIEEPGHAREVGERLRRRLGRVVPFIDDFVIEDAGLVQAPEAAPGDDPLEASGLMAMVPVYRSPAPGPWGACGVPHQTRLRNLFVCSDQVLPGLGDEGSWMTAWSVAGLVTGRNPSRARSHSRSRRWHF